MSEEEDFNDFLLRRKYRLSKNEAIACKKINNSLIKAIRKKKDIKEVWSKSLKKYLPSSSSPKLLDCPSIPYEIYYSQIKENRPHIFLILGVDVIGNILFLDEEQFNIFDQKIVNINKDKKL